MKCTLAISLLIMAPLMLTACDIDIAAPEFDEPKYKPDTKWPKLTPTAKLEQAADVDAHATIAEIEKLQTLVK